MSMKNYISNKECEIMRLRILSGEDTFLTPLEQCSRVVLSNRKVQAGIVGAVVGILCGVYVNIQPEVPILYFSTLATVQGSIFGIIAAIYILSRQLAASEYTLHALTTFQNASEYKVTVSIFSISIFADIIGIALIDEIRSGLITRAVGVSLTLGLAISSFGLLYYMRDFFLDNINVDDIPENIEKEINDLDWRGEITKAVGIPFYQFFETMRSAIRNDDRQAAYEIFEKVAAELSSNTEKDLEDLTELNDEITEGYKKVITEIKEVGIVAVENEHIELVVPVIKWLNKEGARFCKVPAPEIGAKSIRAVSDIHHELVPTDRPTSVSTGVWHGYKEAMLPAAERNQEEPIQEGTIAIGDLVGIVAEEHEEFDVEKSRYSLILRVFLSQFMDIWNKHAENHLEDITVNDLLYKDGKYMEPGEFNKNHNYFEEVFTSMMGHVTSAERTIQLPMVGFSKIAETAIDGLIELIKTASDNDQGDLVTYYIEAVILIAHGFSESTRTVLRLEDKLATIQDHGDDCNSALEEVISCFSNSDNARQRLSYQYYSRAFLHRDYEESDLEEFIEGIEEMDTIQN